MALISFFLLSLCPFLAPATQDCQGNDCPVTVNSLLQVKDKTRTQSEDDVTSAQAITYAEGTDGTNSCLAGYSKIDSESDCIAAAGELSIPWKGELPAGQQSSSPGGCLRNANNHAYYNPTSGGDREENAPICKETPTTTTTTQAAGYEFYVAAMTDLHGRDAGYSSTLVGDGWMDVTNSVTVGSPWTKSASQTAYRNFNVWTKSALASVTLPATTRDGIVTFFVAGASEASVSVSGIDYDTVSAQNGAEFNRDRNYAFSSLDATLNGAVLIQTPHDFPSGATVTLAVEQA